MHLEEQHNSASRLTPRLLVISAPCSCINCIEKSMRTFPPVSPYQLFEGIDADVVRIHVLHLDTALLQVLFVNLVRMPCTAGKKQHYY